MDLWILKPGQKIKTRDSVKAEVLVETQDGARIKVRYLSLRLQTTERNRDAQLRQRV